jgi:uncharacterized protein with PIN domain/tRNA(Ser,Leu) C12 N-acetylase TAN1
MRYLLRLAEAGRESQRLKTRRDVLAVLRERLPDAGLSTGPGRIFVTVERDIAAVLRELHGIVSFSPCRQCALEDVDEVVVDYARDALGTARLYRVRVTRRAANELSSQQLAARFGRRIGEAMPALRVDLENPEVVIGVEIRDAACFVFHEIIAGVDRRDAAPASVGRTPRFLVDRMLGKLVGCLRVLGYDTAYAGEEPDSALLRRARAEGRVLLTRDRALSRARAVCTHFVEQATAIEQMLEVIEAFDLDPAAANMFTRCTLCNRRVEKVDKAEVADRLPSVAREQYDEFTRCRACDKLYWAGSQHARIIDKLGTELGGRLRLS